MLRIEDFMIDEYKSIVLNEDNNKLLCELIKEASKENMAVHLGLSYGATQKFVQFQLNKVHRLNYEHRIGVNEFTNISLTIGIENNGWYNFDINDTSLQMYKDSTKKYDNVWHVGYLKEKLNWQANGSDIEIMYFIRAVILRLGNELLIKMSKGD
jgi:hypothetical protein